MKNTPSLFVAALLCGSPLLAAPLVRSGDKVAFLGDSITQFGNRPDGYVQLVMDGLKRAGVTNLTCVPAGVSGNKSDQMLARVERDVIARKPQWMLLSCGVNDVGHGARGIELEPYRKNIAALCDKVDAAGIRICILTPSLCSESKWATNDNNRKLEGYCAYLRTLAKERGYALADVNAAMRGICAARDAGKPVPKNVTIDNLHMNGYGNRMYAETILRALGVEQSVLDAAQADWDKIPSMTVALNNQHVPSWLVSIDDYRVIEKAARERNCGVQQLVQKIVADKIVEYRRAPNAFRGELGSPLLVTGAGRVYVVETDGRQSWEIRGCGNSHRAFLKDGKVYYANGELWECDFRTKARRCIWKPAKQKGGGVYGFMPLADGGFAMVGNDSEEVVEIAPQADGTYAERLRFKVSPAGRDGTRPKPGDHSRFRMMKKTDAGTYLVCAMSGGCVREYDRTGRLVWEQYVPGAAFDVIRRANGNTLVSHLNGITEYTPAHEVVWQFKPADLPDLKLKMLCSIQETPEGTLVVGTYGNRSDDASHVTFFEMTRDRKVVWSWASTEDYCDMTVYRLP